MIILSLATTAQGGNFCLIMLILKAPNANEGDLNFFVYVFEEYILQAHKKTIQKYLICQTWMIIMCLAMVPGWVIIIIIKWVCAYRGLRLGKFQP